MSQKGSFYFQLDLLAHIALLFIYWAQYGNSTVLTILYIQTFFILYSFVCLSACLNHVQHLFHSHAFCLSLFIFFRQQLSKATFDSPPISPKTPASAVKCRTPKERGQKCTSSVLNHFFQKRPKASPAKESQHDSSVAQRVQRGEMQTARTHNANDADLHSAAAQLPVVVKEEPMDVKVASIHSLMSAKQEDTGAHTNSSWDEKAHSSSPPQDVKPVIKGEAFPLVD